MLHDTVRLVWPITPLTLQTELTTLEAMLARWQERFSNQKFCEMLENEPDEAVRATVFVQLANELKVVASKAVALAEVIT